MSKSTIIRTLVFEALQGYKYNNIAIPVFDEIVNPNVPLPSVNGAQEVYIVLQDQQEYYNAVQNVCHSRTNNDLTIRVVTKWGLIGSKELCEDISNEILALIRTKRGESLLPDSNVQRINLSMSRAISEVTQSNLSFSFITILNFIYNA